MIARPAWLRYGEPMENTPPPAGDRIAKVIARAGVASRRDAERMIEDGRVMVNGKYISSPALNVTARDAIKVDGKLIAEAEPARLWLYHKPIGLVTSARDEKGRKTVFETLPPELPRVMSVGRLDINSEGLLLLTNDGGLKRKLELPSTGWLRRYRVRVNGTPEEATIEPLRNGIEVEGERFQAMEVKFDRQQGANAWLTIGIREGKNREIRRAMGAVGLAVNRLIRVSYGPFQLGGLKEGAVEEIKTRVLRDQLGMDPDDSDPETAKKPGRPVGTAKARAKPAGFKPGGGRSDGPKPKGPNPTGPRPMGPKPAGAKPTGQKPIGQKPAGRATLRRKPGSSERG